MNDPRLEQVQRKTRRRLVFTALHLVLYFTFTLNWMALGDFLRNAIGGGPINGSLLMFILLVLTFIALEFLFLSWIKNRSRDHEPQSRWRIGRRMVGVVGRGGFTAITDTVGRGWH